MDYFETPDLHSLAFYLDFKNHSLQQDNLAQKDLWEE